MTVRTRFAPSPTGYMHIGNVRTALFAWLYARRHQGKFVLRIEDTDSERSKPEYTQVIIDTLQWLKLDYDEGPYYQSKRLPRYKAVAEQLIKEGKAYRCYCSKERLQVLREEQIKNKEKPKYDGRCRDLKEPQHEPFVIRFRNPKEGVVELHDLVYGDLKFQNDELDDLILIREDGIPTYNFACVIDDLEMNITHVIRGDDHINNTPRQINIYKALGAEPPKFVHLPSIVGNDGKRLSKRHGAVNVAAFREEGFLPEALINELVRLGWSNGNQEIFSYKEMTELFDLNHIHKSPAVFDKTKLVWLNQHYLKTLDPEIVAKELKWHFEKLNVDIKKGPALTDVVKAQAERCKTLYEMAERSRFFYEDVDTYDKTAAMKHFTEFSAPILQHILEECQNLSAWEQEKLHQIVIQTGEAFKVKLGKIAQPIRVALTGVTISPPIDITLTLLGKEKTTARLDRAIKFIINQCLHSQEE